MGTNNSFLELDYVYTADGTLDYRNVRVSVSVGDETAVITILPENEMSKTELNSIFDELESDLLKKTKISLTDECHIELKMNGYNHTVTLADHRVVNIERVG